MILLNNNNYNNSKKNTYSRQNNYREDKNETIILTYYIQIKKRLPCLICSKYIKFIYTKSIVSLYFMVPVQFFLP